MKSKIDLTSALCFPDALVLLLRHRLLPAAAQRRAWRRFRRIPKSHPSMWSSGCTWDAFPRLFVLSVLPALATLPFVLLAFLAIDPSSSGHPRGGCLFATEARNRVAEPKVVPIPALRQQNCPGNHICVPAGSQFTELPRFASFFARSSFARQFVLSAPVSTTGPVTRRRIATPRGAEGDVPPFC